MRLPLHDPAAAAVCDVMTNSDYQFSTSQFGEDLVLEVLFAHKSAGFYVDVGAHHPTRLSNTNLLHRRGWRGINIDLDARAITEFQAKRPNDVNLVAAVSDKAERVDIHFFDERAVNTISGETAVKYGQSGWTEEAVREVVTMPLSAILATHLPPGTQVDLLNVDVEGVDMKVLQGNDWTKYRPAVVLIEVGETDLMLAAGNECLNYMRDLGYKLVSLCYLTGIFVDGRPR